MEQTFQKLVRDFIPEKIEKNGEIAVTRILEDSEFRKELYQKLLEEANEVIHANTKDERLMELADVFEVLRVIAELEGSNIEEVEEKAKAKRLKRGGFDKRIFLEKTYSIQ